MYLYMICLLTIFITVDSGSKTPCRHDFKPSLRGRHRHRPGHFKIPEKPWGDFTPPKNVWNSWERWLTEYEKKQKRRLPPVSNADFPYEWLGMGPGSPGVESPPPWSYGPVNTGLPDYCYHPLDGGTESCALASGVKIERFAYNPYMDRCESFMFTNCGGNQNNFLTEKVCVKHCMKRPPTGCGSDA